MIHTTTWRPDTCECIIDYEWDDLESAETRVHTAVDSSPCPAHKTQTGDHLAVMATVLDENTRKNLTMQKILKTFPQIGENKEPNPNKPPANWFKPGHEPAWHFDKSRNLMIETKILDDSQKETLRQIVQHDKVTIV